MFVKRGVVCFGEFEAAHRLLRCTPRRLVSMSNGQQQQKGVPIASLPTDQLDRVGKQLDREVSRLQQSAQFLGSLASEYTMSSKAVQELKELQDGTVLCTK